MYSSHHLSRGIHFLLLLLTCKKYELILLPNAEYQMSTLSQIISLWVFYLHKLVIEKVLGFEVSGWWKYHLTVWALVFFRLGRFHAGVWGIFPDCWPVFPLCLFRRIWRQNYASLGICLHKGLLKRSPLCKLRLFSATNLSPGRRTNVLRRPSSLPQLPSVPAGFPKATPRPRCHVSPFLHVAECESLAVPSFVSLPPPVCSLWGSSRSSRPAPRGLQLIRQLPPLPGARTQSAAPPRPASPAPRPAQAAFPYIRVSTPAAQTLALWSWRRGRQCWGGTGRAPRRRYDLCTFPAGELSVASRAAPGSWRPLREGWARGGKLAGRGTRARPALPEPQPLGLAEAAAAREACGALTWGWAWGVCGSRWRWPPRLGAERLSAATVCFRLSPELQLTIVGGVRPARWRPWGFHEGRGRHGGRGCKHSQPLSGFRFLPGLWRACPASAI